MITIDSPRGDRPIQLPTRADGARYRYELIYNAGAHRAYSDTLTGLISALIPGYLDATTAEADALRLRYVVDHQVRIQANLATPQALRACTPDQRKVLLGPRHVPPMGIGEWRCAVPLVLVDTFYEPVGSHPRPDGNVVWLSPGDETSFLETLTVAGAIDVAEHRSP